MEAPEAAIGELEERLGRYRRDRYPVQHATAQFHLGVALAGIGDVERAEAALATAAELFDPRTLRAEHAKALNALGSVVRLAGRPEEAAQIFGRAASAFETDGLRVEQAAACFNLGLVRRELDDVRGSITAFTRAQGLFDAAHAAAHAAAAARELGASLFAAGELDAARDALEHAVAGAARAGDALGAGSAANVLGLVELAAGRPGDAVAAFVTAAAAHARRVRPAEHAMAKANLALAHEQVGDPLRARVAAHQALGVPDAPPPVRAQAETVLRRVGPGDPDDVSALLADEGPEARAALVRDELGRWVDVPDGDRAREAAAWVDGQLARPAAALTLAEAWLAGILELPPAELEAVARAVVAALAHCDPAAQERFRAEVSMALARFHVPQLIRLRDTFNRIATELGEEAAWR